MLTNSVVLTNSIVALTNNVVVLTNSFKVLAARAKWGGHLSEADSPLLGVGEGSHLLALGHRRPIGTLV